MDEIGPVDWCSIILLTRAWNWSEIVAAGQFRIGALIRCLHIDSKLPMVSCRVAVPGNTRRVRPHTARRSEDGKD